MALRPLRECLHAGCTSLVRGLAYCPSHTADARLYDLNRPSPSRRGYGRAWAKIRKAQLLNEPLCRRCKAEGVVKLATEVDHIVPLAAGGDSDSGNLQSLCKVCHTSKTNAEDGGLGRPIHRSTA